MSSPRRGASLLELLVAFLILELTAAAALAGAITLERLRRHAERGATTDAARWEAYRLAERAPACVGAVTPVAVPTTFISTVERPTLAGSVRCGR